jgi:hypothetical protein
VEHTEEVALVGVVVDLGPLALREDVLDVERVPAEAVGEQHRRLVVGRVEVDPGEAVGVELGRLRPWARDQLPDRAGTHATDPRQAWHRYSGGRRSSPRA